MMDEETLGDMLRDNGGHMERTCEQVLHMLYERQGRDNMQESSVVYTRVVVYNNTRMGDDVTRRTALLPLSATRMLPPLSLAKPDG
jgi:hypothetical protein